VAVKVCTCNGGWVKSDRLTISILTYEHVSVLTIETNLELLKNCSQVVSCFGELAKNVALVCAPEEATLWETRMSITISANSDVVVIFKSCNG
jgi:hypothetical protein